MQSLSLSILFLKLPVDFTVALSICDEVLHEFPEVVTDIIVESHWLHHRNLDLNPATFRMLLLRALQVLPDFGMGPRGNWGLAVKKRVSQRSTSGMMIQSAEKQGEDGADWK
ncbi:hypothetical protein PAPYR_4856 [Paratrimastix pyriformis]|uniref:Uncharacterized protein n=1 Tax=Paratrimastix pyriformis TaxID=342808 RepID=A0ABQ8UNL3_9EUKA|nr:hypothetical protein PAPYR_4856 [Paratrimastix pyriformis]